MTLIDPGPPGGACSAGNAGWITLSMAGPLPAPGVVGQSVRWMLRRDSPLYIRPGAVPALAGWLLQFWRHCNPRDYQAGLEAVAGLAAGTMRRFDELAAEMPIEMHEQGILYAFLSRTALEHVGHGQTLLSSSEVREREPALGPGVVGGFLVAGERHVRPETLTRALHASLGRDEAVSFVQTRATGFTARGGTVTAVRTSQGDVPGDTFLVAAGVWSGALAGGLQVQAGKGYSVTIEQPAVRLRGPLYLDEARVACSPFDGALRLAGTMEFAGLDAALDPMRVAAMGRASDMYLPAWRQGGKTAVWAGMRPVTPDGLPVIGRLPAYENAFVATGHAMLGVTLAPATAAVVADLICDGRAGVDLSAFDPDRFSRPRH